MSDPNEVYGRPLPIDREALRLVENRMEFLAARVDTFLEIAALGDWTFLILALESEGGGSCYVTGARSREEMIAVARRQGRRLALAEPPPGIKLVRGPGALTRRQVRDLAQAARASAAVVREAMPKGWVFGLILFAREGDHLVYISNGEHDDMARALQESADRWERHEDRPPGLLDRDV